MNRIFPGTLEDLRIRGVVVRNILRPAGDIQPERNRVMLSHDEATLGGKLHLRVVGENPRARRHHVSFQAKTALEDLDPDRKRNATLVYSISRGPTGQQI